MTYFVQVPSKGYALQMANHDPVTATHFIARCDV